MNAEENAAAAEELAGQHGEWYYADADKVPAIVARAHVHATLALAQQTARVAEWLRDIAGQVDRLQLPDVVVVDSEASVEEIAATIDRLRNAGRETVSTGTLPDEARRCGDTCCMGGQ